MSADSKTGYAETGYPETNDGFDEFKPLTNKQRKYLELVVYEGYQHWRAYNTAFPPEKGERSKDNACRKGMNLLSRPHIKAEYNRMREENKKKLQEKWLWTKEDSIKHLREVIDFNEDELRRIDETYNKQIDLLLLKIDESDSIDEKDNLLQEVFSLRKQRRSSTTNSSAILSAITELNKMHGFNTQELVIKNKEEYETDKTLKNMSIEELRKIAYGK